MNITTTAKLQELAASYQRAQRTFNNNRLGATTDRAEARMEKVTAEAEALGTEAFATFLDMLSY